MLKRFVNNLIFLLTIKENVLKKKFFRKKKEKKYFDKFDIKKYFVKEKV